MLCSNLRPARALAGDREDILLLFSTTRRLLCCGESVTDGTESNGKLISIIYQDITINIGNSIKRTDCVYFNQSCVLSKPSWNQPLSDILTKVIQVIFVLF